MRRLRAMTDKDEAAAAFIKVSSLLDKLARKGIISKNKAANLKSKLQRHVNKLAAAAAWCQGCSREE